MIQNLKNNVGAGNGDRTRTPRFGKENTFGDVRADRVYNQFISCAQISRMS